MVKLDDRVERAVRILWLERAFDNGKEAFALLTQAVKEGDGDACYFLARCYAGSSFIDPGFHFPIEDDKVEEYLNQSIERGSALGMFAARRVAGFQPRCGSFVREPYHSSKEIWDEVCAIADSGELFTKYLVANAYYFGDVAQLTEMDFSRMTKIELDWQFRRWAEKAASMYDELIHENMIMGVPNYIDILTSGDYGVPKNEKKAQEIMQLAADKGDPFYIVKIGMKLEETEPARAEEYYKRALSYDYKQAGFYLGKLYSFRGKMPRNLKKARDFFEQYLSGNEIGCHNYLGEIYFYGGDGIEPDFNKAFQHLLASHDKENYWGSEMLGTCYLKGLGTTVNYTLAKQEFERYPDQPLSAIGLGEIYAYGLGAPEDIKKAMTYWDKYPNHASVVENKKNFKKTLLGWKRK